MSGGETWEERGIIPRTFSHLFKYTTLMNRDPYTKYQLYVSYFEIYNENGYDLLDRKHADLPFEKWNKINMYEDMNQNFHLKNLSVHECDSEQTAIDLLMMGNYVRRVSSTPMNQTSSRSHCIFTLSIEIKDLKNNSIRSSKLHLVDLAGSERIYKTEADC
jgi:kinesin family protein 6/9